MLRPFTCFGNNRPIPDDFDGDPAELAVVMGESDEWFDPAEGRAAIHALATYIKGNRKIARKITGAKTVILELEDLVRVLVAAEAEDVQFRLEMS